MARLADVTVDELRTALESVEGRKPALRLFAAIASKHGVTQSELAEWFDVERKTIYNWLTRLEAGDFETAVRDADRPGRPRKLTDAQLAELEMVLQHRPSEVGFDAPAWTTALVLAFVRERFGVEYSRPSCRRLLKGAGLRHRTARQAAAELDPGALEAAERDLREFGHVWLPRG